MITVPCGASSGNRCLAYSDPWGLCPPKDTNTGDCGNDNIGKAWQLLDRTEAGRAVIKDYVALNPSVVSANKAQMQSRCGQVSEIACSNWAAQSVTLPGSMKPGAMAVSLAHEIHHLKTRVPQRSEAGVQDEMGAYGSAGAIYAGFAADATDDKSFGEAVKVFGKSYDIYYGNPAEAERRIRCAAIRVGC